MSKFLFKEDKNELYNQYYPLATNTEKEEFLINNGSSLLKILEKRKKDREYELYALQKLQKQNYRNKDYYMIKKERLLKKQIFDSIMLEDKLFMYDISVDEINYALKLTYKEDGLFTKLIMGITGTISDTLLK